MTKLFLGLDASTQSLSAIVIDLNTSKVIYETSFNYDQALPQYQTQNGVLLNPDPLVKHSSPFMWADALDLIFLRMKNERVPLAEIQAICGSGQQHGSVYFNESIKQVLAQLNPNKSLVENLQNVFSRKTSPIWMDSSTTIECAEIRTALGGIKNSAQLTGSDIFERFSGPQIRKFYKNEPEHYEQTSHIALVSSFMASLLAGHLAPIDFGDGAGMNLMDIRKKHWNKQALQATAPNLINKLPRLEAAGTVIGKVSAYFVRKFGLNPKAVATVWTGDNPASLVGLGLVEAGQVAISLGTSDTYLGTMDQCEVDEKGEGHVFGSPTGGYMSLIVFKNGSLAREKIREHYGIQNWQEFEKLVASTPPGNDDGILIPWFEAEIVPKVIQPGIERFDLDEKNVAANCRAICEAQMLAMRVHAMWMKVSPKKIFATGGASNNITLLQIMANVMNCSVQRIDVSNSAALGAAIIAADFEFFHSELSTEIHPDKNSVKIYDQLLKKYTLCEKKALKKLLFMEDGK